MILADNHTDSLLIYADWLEIRQEINNFIINIEGIIYVVQEFGKKSVGTDFCSVHAEVGGYGDNVGASNYHCDNVGINNYRNSVGQLIEE